MNDLAPSKTPRPTGNFCADFQTALRGITTLHKPTALRPSRPLHA